MSSEQELPSIRLWRLWCFRAEECRSLAETFFHDPQTRDRVLRVAEEYDRMALWAERELLEDEGKEAKRQAASIAYRS